MRGEYPNTRRVVYEHGAQFVPVCRKCGRYVKADDTIRYSEGRGLANEPNATCSKCGRTKMLFDGFM
jgi:ribosomal protein L32